MAFFRSRAAFALAGAAALAMTASPAMARGWHHRDRGLDAGDVFTGLLILGGIAAVASAASRNARRSDAPPYRYPDARYPDENDRDYRDAPYPDRREGAYRDAPGGYGRDRDDSPYGQRDEAHDPRIDEAVDTCVDEIERGSRRVGSVDRAEPAGPDWRIDGTMEDGRAFTCSIDRDMRVRRVAIDGRAII